MPVVILIPPSESKIPGGRLPALGSLKNKSVKNMIDRLNSYSGDLSYLLGVKDKALTAAREANNTILTSLTLPAIERYSGVVYDGINYPTLSQEAQTFFNTHVRIISALFGLLDPQTPIPDYKLKIEKLDAASYWQPIISQQLKDYFVIDLLPQTHQKAVNYMDGVKVEFIVSKNGKVMPAGHQGKLIKGKFVRFLCENKITDPKDFGGFKEDGYRFNGLNFVKG